jgi:hypothetical protein
MEFRVEYTVIQTKFGSFIEQKFETDVGCYAACAAVGTLSSTVLASPLISCSLRMEWRPSTLPMILEIASSQRIECTALLVMDLTLLFKANKED